MIKRDMRVLWALGLGLVMLTGCGDDGGRPADSGTARDSSTATDSGVTLMDGGMDTGTTPTDSGVDTGTTPTDSGTAMCPSGACDLLTGSGCTTAGEGCYFLSMAMGADPAPLCAPAGTAGDGASCTQTQDCQEGFICDAASAGATGVCRHYCCGGSDTGCPLGQRCAVNLVDGTGMPTGVGFCRLPDTCDLLAQTGCASGQGCYPSGSDGSVICVTPGTGADGSTCSAGNDCAPSLLCLASGTCAKLCNRTAGGPECAGGETCGGLTGFGDTVGVCTTPAGG